MFANLLLCYGEKVQNLWFFILDIWFGDPKFNPSLLFVFSCILPIHFSMVRDSTPHDFLLDCFFYPHVPLHRNFWLYRLLRPLFLSNFMSRGKFASEFLAKYRTKNLICMLIISI